MMLYRCSVHETGQLDASSQAVDGIMGFGQSNTSVVSQLASGGKVKKMFAHCLDGVNGGGIFIIGQVVEPRVKMTPLVANQYVVFCYLTENILISRPGISSCYNIKHNFLF